MARRCFIDHQLGDLHADLVSLGSIETLQQQIEGLIVRRVTLEVIGEQRDSLGVAAGFEAEPAKLLLNVRPGVQRQGLIEVLFSFRNSIDEKVVPTSCDQRVNAIGARIQSLADAFRRRRGMLSRQQPLGLCRHGVRLDSIPVEDLADVLRFDRRSRSRPAAFAIS
jgi:hypothetical protein